MRPRWHLPSALALLVVLVAPAAGAGPDPAPGRTIYREGRSPRGASITAVVGGTILPGEAIPCAGCHGPDGRGRPEGGVVPPDIAWSTLTKPYGHVHPDGRRHPAFDERTASLAVAEGIDPAGNELAPAMPRYSMAADDLRDLLDYLQAIEREPAAGTSPTSIRIACALPSAGPLASLGTDVRALLEAEFEELDRAGGIHGRRLELAIAAFDPARETATAALRELHAQAPVFALVGGVVPGAEEEVAEFAAREGWPWIGPLTHLELEAGAEWVFRPQAGLSEEARVLVRHAATSLPRGARRGAVVHPRGFGFAAAARAAREEAGHVGLVLETVEYPPGGFDRALADRLAGTGFVVFLGGDDDLRVLVRRNRGHARRPAFLVPGTGAVRAALEAGPTAHVRLAFAAVPDDEAPAARERLARLSPAYRSGRFPAALVSAHASVAVLAEGLRCAGRQLDARRLVECLERLDGLETGLLPPIGFGPGRRVGSRGGYVVVTDGRGGLRREGGFVRLEVESGPSR